MKAWKTETIVEPLLSTKRWQRCESGSSLTTLNKGRLHAIFFEPVSQAQFIPTPGTGLFPTTAPTRDRDKQLLLRILCNRRQILCNGRRPGRCPPFVSVEMEPLQTAEWWHEVMCNSRIRRRFLTKMDEFLATLHSFTLSINACNCACSTEQYSCRTMHC